MKKRNDMLRFLTVIAGFILFGMVLAIYPIRVDPHNVFHAEHIRDNGVEPNKNYIKMKHVLKKTDTFDALRFGSSRVGALHVEEIAEEHCYNMAYSEGTPAEHLANLKTLIKKKVPFKKVYIGVDSLSYTLDASTHRTTLFRMPYEMSVKDPLHFWLRYLDGSMAIASLEVSAGHTPEEGFAEHFYRIGEYYEYGREPDPSWHTEDSEPVIGSGMYPEETLEAIREICRICNENGIEPVFFTNPLSTLTLEASLKRGYADFLRQLSGITGFYNFSGYNRFTEDDGNFIDGSHYLPEVGREMLLVLQGQEPGEEEAAQGFGLYVTAENVEEVLETAGMAA